MMLEKFSRRLSIARTKTLTQPCFGGAPHLLQFVQLRQWKHKIFLPCWRGHLRRGKTTLARRWPLHKHKTQRYNVSLVSLNMVSYPKMNVKPGKWQSLFTVIDDVLYYVDPKRNNRKRAVVPQSLKKPILEQTHAGPYGGHFSGQRTFDTLASSWWWEHV